MAKVPPIYQEHDKVYWGSMREEVVRAAEAGQVHHEALSRSKCSYPGKRLGRSELPGIANIGFWDAIGEQDWGVDWHRDGGIELTFLETGSLHFAVDSKQYLLHPGDLTITRPWQLHRVGNPNIGAGRRYFFVLDVGVRRPNQAWKWPAWLVMTKPDLRELTIMLRRNEHPVWSVTADIRHCFERIGQAVETNHSGSSTSRLIVYLNELFVLVLEMLRRQNFKLNPSLSSTRRTVELFLNDLHQNLESLAQPWSLPSMAKHCGLCTAYFVQHCKQLTNMTPVQYLNYQRIEAASELLVKKPKMSITKIAFACGFYSSQYFATVFRQYTGCSPRDYRTKHLS